jgi:hypothetical protein
MAPMSDHSNLKTAALAVFAAAAFIAAAFVTVAPAASEPLIRPIERVHAVGVSQTGGASDFNEWRARRMAIENWRRDVARRYGIEFAQWTSARRPEVQCDGRARFVRCDASAIPALRTTAGSRRWNLIRG